MSDIKRTDAHSKHGSAVRVRERREESARGGTRRWEKRDKVGKTEACFDVEGISVVYSEAFHQLLRLSASFLPHFFSRQFLESCMASRYSLPVLRLKEPKNQKRFVGKIKDLAVVCDRADEDFHLLATVVPSPGT